MNYGRRLLARGMPILLVCFLYFGVAAIATVLPREVWQWVEPRWLWLFNRDLMNVFGYDSFLPFLGYTLTSAFTFTVLIGVPIALLIAIPTKKKVNVP